MAFTRDPSTGEKHFYGEFLINAQGEDVVAGTRTPQQLNVAGRDKLPAGNEAKDLPTLEEAMPEAYATLRDIRERLEAHYRNMQDIEFTIQEGRLWMLQTRHGKRTGVAAIRVAAEMHAEGLVDRGRGAAAGGARRTWTSCCTTRSIPRRTSTCWAPACRPPRARPRARWPSAPRTPWPWRPPAARCCWCGARPAPRTSRA